MHRGIPGLVVVVGRGGQRQRLSFCHQADLPLQVLDDQLNSLLVMLIRVLVGIDQLLVLLDSLNDYLPESQAVDHLLLSLGKVVHLLHNLLRVLPLLVELEAEVHWLNAGQNDGLLCFLSFLQLCKFSFFSLFFLHLPFPFLLLPNLLLLFPLLLLQLFPFLSLLFFLKLLQSLFLLLLFPFFLLFLLLLFLFFSKFFLLLLLELLRLFLFFFLFL